MFGGVIGAVSMAIVAPVFPGWRSGAASWGGQRADGFIERFDVLAFIVMGAMAVAVLPMWVVDRQVKAKLAAGLGGLASPPTPAP